MAQGSATPKVRIQVWDGSAWVAAEGENFRGQERLAVFDRKNYNALNEAVHLLAEIRELLKEGNS